MSRDIWSILPQPADMVAEVRTRRYRTLTYARRRARPRTSPSSAGAQAQHRDLRLAAEAGQPGATTTRTTCAENDVLDYDIEIDVSPSASGWSAARVMQAAVKALAGALTLTLGDTYTISSVTSKELGRLLFLRVRNQNLVVVTCRRLCRATTS